MPISMGHFELRETSNILGINHETRLLFGRGPNRVMETACFDANVQ